MGLFAAALRFIAENRPDLLATLPRDLLDREAHEHLDRGEIYDYEQLNKVTDVAAEAPRALLERRMVAALRACRVDDFCFLHAQLEGPVSGQTIGETIGQTALDEETVRTACDTLLRRGNVAGLEQVIARTGVRPQIAEAVARRAYDVLVATGRLGAIDYVRQLSGLEVAFSPEAVLLGYRTLLLSSRFGALRELARYAPPPAELRTDEIDRALERALQELELAGAVVLCEVFGRPCTLAADEVPGYLARLRATGRIAELPALFRLAPAADPAQLSRADVEGLLRLDDPVAVRFLYRQPALAEKLAGYELQAYRTAVEHRDLEAVRAVCERAGPGFEPAEAGDHPAAHEALDWLGGEPDAGVERFALALRDGRFAEALAAERADSSSWRQLPWVAPLCRALEAAEEARRRKRGA
jgi:hypothetical protein